MALNLRTQLFINNEWVDAVSKKSFPSINPVTEETITMAGVRGSLS